MDLRPKKIQKKMISAKDDEVKKRVEQRCSQNLSRCQFQFVGIAKDMFGEILKFCTIRDSVALYTTCRSLKRYVEELIPFTHLSFDWGEEGGKIGGLEFLYRLNVPVEAIVLDTTIVVAQSTDRKLPTNDPFLFVARYISSTQNPSNVIRLSATSSTSTSTNTHSFNTGASNNSARPNNETHEKQIKSLFKHLKSLIVRGIYTTYDAGLIAISNFCFPNLQILILSFLPTLSALTAQKIISSSPALTHLSLERSYNAATNETLVIVKKSCPKLKTLSLAYCSLITDSGLYQLASQTEEWHGEIRSNRENFQTPSFFQSLQELSLAHCYELSSSAVTTATQSMTNLMVLSLEWCFLIDDGLLYVLANAKNRLTVLGIEHCERITDEGISYFIRRKPSLLFFSADSCSLVGFLTASALTGPISKILQDLYLNSCPLLTDDDVINICSHCTQLRSLGIEDCDLTDLSVIAVAQNCPQITVLGLNNNIRISDDGLNVLLIKLSLSIERLYISQTSVTNQTLNRIAERCRTLFSLSLIKCENISYDGLKYLGDARYHCARTLQDLHLSTEMRRRDCFYGGLRASVNGTMASHDDDNYDDDEEMNAEAENVAPSNIAHNGCKKPPIEDKVDVQYLLFGNSINEIPHVKQQHRCIVYFR